MAILAMVARPGMRRPVRRRGRAPARRGFTVVEMIVAGMIIAFVWGTITMSLRQLSLSKGASREQLQAYMRADAALSGLRRDAASTIRSADLFWTRVLISDSAVNTSDGYLDRDELLIFNTRMRPTREVDYLGEGTEYETQYRITEDDLGPVLWQRRDAVVDEYPAGGGVATPQVDGIISLGIEAFDGEQWRDEWDSDLDGMPFGLRITVVASGHDDPEDVLDAPRAVLRTVIPIDRVPLPSDLIPDEPAEDEAAGDEAGDDAAGDDGSGGGDGGGGDNGGEGGGAIPGGPGGPPPPGAQPPPGGDRGGRFGNRRGTINRNSG